MGEAEWTPTRRYRLGFDIGGTFTDFVLWDTQTGTRHAYKRLTTQQDPAIGAMDGVHALLRQAGISATALETVVHGTTLVANTLIERTGAKVGLLTTQGFRDTLEIRTEQRYDIYDLFLQFPEPLVPRYLRVGVRERTDRDGRVLLEPDEDELRVLSERLRAEGAEAVAISFLHAYRNPHNEQVAGEFMTRALPGLPLSLSSEVAPEIREYERTSTTVANAYVQPRLRRYLNQLEHRLREAGYCGRLYLMLSSGGSTSARTASEFPIRLVESGPAAGAIAAAHFGALAGQSDVISFDMGGTTAKICLIDGGQPTLARDLEVARLHRFRKGSGLPLQFPAVDMIEIGAGGGSIAHRDRLGLLKVGPASAGADPGPACYGLGGQQPTVTDANLLLGYLDPEYFLGGQMRLDVSAAECAVARVAQPLGLSVVEAAWGIHQLVNENMAAATKIHIIERARDPRHYALLAYGGGGPLHGPGVARTLSVPEVICPPAAGVASAVGLLIAPLSFELAHSYPLRWDRADLAELNRMLLDLQHQGELQLAEAGIHSGITVERSADGRFVGQLHELTIPLPSGPLSARAWQNVPETFAEQYRQHYSHLPHEMPVEFLSWRVTVSGPRPGLEPNRLQTHQTGQSPGNANAADARRGERPAYFGPPVDFIATPVYDRYAMTAGMQIHGPAIVEERESTALIYPGMTGYVDVHLNLIITTNPVA